MIIELHPYKPEYLPEVLSLFRQTVHSVNSKHYTPEQLNAWAPEQLDENKWQQTLGSNYTLVAKQDNKIVGFADIDATGYFDHLFVHRDYQGQGVAKLLADAIENYAQAERLKIISVAASITAKPFFERRDYKVLKQQSVERLGQVLTNYLMEKQV